jgi:two-component sensor histidine kinase/predicted hydrocarbon binding protein
MEKNDNLPLYSSRITNTYVEYLERFYPDINVNNILEYAGMTRHEVEDPGHWFTQKQVDRFHEQVIDKSGNSDLPREVGRFIASAESTGAVKQYGLGLMNPLSVYLMVAKFYRIMTKGAKAKAGKLGPNKVEITVTPNKTTKEKPYQCLNRIGTFESLAKAFTGRYAKVVETNCFHKGDNHCRYVIEWDKTLSLRMKSFRNYLIFGGVLLAPILYILLPFKIWCISISALISSSLILSLYSDIIDKKELYKTIKTQGNAAEELVSEINIRHNNAMLVREIGQVTSTIVDIDLLIRDVMESIMRHLRTDRAMILLTDETDEMFHFHTGIGYDDEFKKSLISSNFNASDNSRNSLIRDTFNSGLACLSNQMDSSNERKLINANLYEHAGSYSIICVPIIYEKKVLGILVVENIEERKQLTQSDMSLLIGVASQIAVGINNVRSFQKLRSIKEELQRSHADLEVRVEERTAELEKLNRELNIEIAERLKSENRLRTFIKEKDVLIKEVHHRVKNNLQVISSLLDMSKRRAKHPETVDLLSEAHAKIFTMSLIHSQLYQSDRIDEINMGRYIRDLVAQLAQMHRGDRNINLNINAADMYLSVTQATPCALVVNEIISNAYKHAFDGKYNGNISILLEEIDGQKMHMNIKDNGIGIPHHLDIDNTETLGMKLIRDLISKQLKGTLQIKTNDGTEIDILFQLIKS